MTRTSPFAVEQDMSHSLNSLNRGSIRDYVVAHMGGSQNYGPFLGSLL